VLFTDGFDSYASTATCNNVNDSCDAPPHIGNATVLPSYWVPASSGTCETRGGCTTWDDNIFMGPNSVFAVVREEAVSAPNSLKLGASDYYADKTSAAVWLSPSLFPSGRGVSFTFQVWLSNGTDNPPCHCNPFGQGPNNAFVIQAPIGKIRYEGQGIFPNGTNVVGGWEIQNDTAGDLTAIGVYHLTTEKWHKITVSFDWTSDRWNSLVIDGKQPFPIVKGYPTFEPLVSTGGYVDFALFIDPFADNQSIASAPSYGFQPFYAYLDNVNVSVESATMTTTSVTTSTTETGSTTSTSSMGTTTSTHATFTATTTLPNTVTVTSTILTTDTTTSTGLAAATTTTFTTTASTATISSTTTIQTGSTTVLTGVSTLATSTANTTSVTTSLATTTVSGTVFISQTDIYNVTLTSIIQALYQYANEMLKLLGLQPVNRPLIRVITRVIKPP